MSLKSAAKRTACPPGTTTLLALATLTLLSACRSGDEAPAAEVRPVRVTTIESRAIGDTIALTGRVQAQTEINESFRIGGRLIERNVEIGDTVRPGQVLARLDPQNEESGLQAARAQLVAAQAQLVEARNNHARMRDLVAENAVSRAAFDQAVAVLQTAESQVNSARANVNLAENRLSYTQLLATAAGVVTARGAGARRSGRGRQHGRAGGARRRPRRRVRRAGAGQGQRDTQCRHHGRAGRRPEDHRDGYGA